MPELPYASPEEFQRIVTHYPDVPLAELVPGTTSHIVLGERALVSFLTMSAGIHFPAHRHEAEQIMIVIDGYMDEIIGGGKGATRVTSSNVI